MTKPAVKKAAPKKAAKKAAKKTTEVSSHLEIVHDPGGLKEMLLSKEEQTHNEIYSEVCNALVQSHNTLKQFVMALELPEGNPVVEMMKGHKATIAKIS